MREIKWLIAIIVWVAGMHCNAMGVRPNIAVPVSTEPTPQSSNKGVLTNRYGDATWDRYVWLGAHNAFASYGTGHGAWIVANQRKSYEELLDAGVRSLDLDIYDFKSTTWQCVLSVGQDCYGRDIYLCHGNCSGVPGVNYALPRKTLTDALARVARWLRSNPEAVVSITLEDYVKDRKLYLSALQRSGALDLVFNPYVDRTAGKWPRLADMVRQNKRLLIFTDAAGNAGLDTATGLDSEFMTKNYWSIGSDGESVRCTARWSKIPLADRSRPFHMSHFRDVAVIANAVADNAGAKLRGRIINECYASAKRYPNVLLLDFADIGDGRNVVEWLNAPGVSP